MGTRGAGLAAFGLDPDYCMVVDVTHAAVPEVTERVLSPMDSGVVIDVAAITDRKLTMMVKDLCEAEKIPYTLRACPGSTGTNANVMGICADGIPTVLCSLPIKNMHSPAEVLSLSDAQAVADMVAAFISSAEIGEVYAR
jgi:endoglucanase